MRKGSRRLRRASIAGAIALVLTGCSGGGHAGPSAASLIASAKSSLERASSVFASGPITVQGQNGNIHAALTRSGDIKGSIIVGSEFDDALVVGGISYVVMDSPAFRAIHQSLHLPLSACARVCGDYLRLPGSPFSPVTLSALTSWFAAMFPAAASVTAVRLVTLQPGQRAYELSTAKGQLLYVTVRAPHYPLEIVDPSEGTTGFSQWNAVPPIKAPPPSQVLHR